MDAKKKYLSDIKALLYYSGEKEKAYLNDIKNRVNDFDDVSYEQLVEQLGEPAEVVEYFYPKEDTPVIAKKVSNVKTKEFLLGGIFLLAAMIIVIHLIAFFDAKFSYLTREVENLGIQEKKGDQ